MGCASRSAPRTRPAAWRKRCANWWARHDDDGSGTLMPPFSRVTVIGLGLIGSSIARGIRARMPDVRVTGYDASAEVRDTARAIDLCDAVPDSAGASENGRAPVRTPVTTAHSVCPLHIEKKN